MPGPAFCTNTDGACTYVNAAWADITGLPIDDALGEGWLTAIHPEDRADVARQWQSFAGGDSTFSAEFRFVHRHAGTAQWIRAQASRLLGRDGGVLCVLGSCTNVDDLHAAQRDSEERARLLKMSDALMQVGHWHVDTASGRLDWSDEVHRIHGTDPKTFVPKLEDGLNAYHPDDRDYIAGVVQAASEGGEPYSFEARLIRTDGEQRIVRGAGHSVRARAGDKDDVIGVFQDVTEQRALADRLAASEQRYALAVAASNDGLWDWDV
ncbi:unnamed protein product, partial [Laminaria digitata]